MDIASETQKNLIETSLKLDNCDGPGTIGNHILSKSAEFPLCWYQAQVKTINPKLKSLIAAWTEMLQTASPFIFFSLRRCFLLI